MTDPGDHPQRQLMVDELHARPFPALAVPCTAFYLALKEPLDAANRDRARDRAQLAALCARHGVPPPPEEAGHVTLPLGAAQLKWESHTEFVSYAVFTSGLSEPPFAAPESLLPSDWQGGHAARRIAALSIRVEPLPDQIADLTPHLAAWFVPESLCLSAVVDGAAVIAGDFRLDAAGIMRFAVFVRAGTGPQRVGRIVQRLAEIEIYRAMSMLGLNRARELSARLNALDPRLNALAASMSEEQRAPEATLHDLLAIAAELEALGARHSFRFGATGAYEALVGQRIAVLREARIEGRQTFGEFMARRYDPAMRTVASARRRLSEMLERATRAGELLRTRVEVDRSAQNQALLESMDRRADLQLRLQHTVEGLSVVAIGYYAVSLATYALLPFAEALHLPKSALTAALVPLVLGGAWIGLKRVKRGIGH